MGDNQLNGSVDALAQALRNVISEAVTQSVQSIRAEIKEDIAAMEKRLLDRMAANHVDHEAWIRNLENRTAQVETGMESLKADVGTLKADMTEVKARLAAGEQ